MKINNTRARIFDKNGVILLNREAKISALTDSFHRNRQMQHVLEELIASGFKRFGISDNDVITEITLHIRECLEISFEQGYRTGCLCGMTKYGMDTLEQLQQEPYEESEVTKTFSVIEGGLFNR